MLDNITTALQQTATQSLGLLFAMLLGVFSSATSTCCTLPTLGVMVGYSGTQDNSGKGTAFKKALFFILGTVVSLMIIGGVAGFAGQVAQANLGQYWKNFAGVVLIIFGLATLKILPFKMSFGKLDGIKKRLGTSGVIVSGFILGGLVSVSALCCLPAIFVVMGVAILQKQVFRAVLLLFMFAIGFSLPLGAILFGVSVSKARFIPQSAEKIVQWVAGGLMLIVGFYFLLTF